MTDHVVYVVDDDERILEALDELLASHGMRAIALSSAGDYVAAEKPDLPACLVLDIELPDINGLELQRRIAAGEHPPIVFITGHGEIPSSLFESAATRRGATHRRGCCSTRVSAGSTRSSPTLECWRPTVSSCAIVS